MVIGFLSSCGSAGAHASVRERFRRSENLTMSADSAMGIPVFLLSVQVRGLTDRPQGGGQGQDRTVDLPLFSWTPPGPGLVLLLCWPQRPRSAVAPALRTRPCHTGTRARPRLSTPAIFRPMPTAARRPAAAGCRWPASHPVTPSARPGMTHREERGPCAD